MSKTVNEVLSQIKGSGHETETITGKGSFSSSAFSDFVNALANDKSYTTQSVDKSGNIVETNISEMLTADVKKTLDNAGYPQKSEVDVVEGKIATNGLAKVIPHVITEWLRTGKKFPLAPQKDFVGDIFLTPVAGKTKEVEIKDFTTREPRGTSIITTQDSVQVRVKSPVPKHLVTKVRKDVSGKVIE